MDSIFSPLFFTCGQKRCTYATSIYGVLLWEYEKSFLRSLKTFFLADKMKLAVKPSKNLSLTPCVSIIRVGKERQFDLTLFQTSPLLSLRMTRKKMVGIRYYHTYLVQTWVPNSSRGTIWYQTSRPKTKFSYSPSFFLFHFFSLLFFKIQISSTLFLCAGSHHVVSVHSLLHLYIHTMRETIYGDFLLSSSTDNDVEPN